MKYERGTDVFYCIEKAFHNLSTKNISVFHATLAIISSLSLWLSGVVLVWVDSVGVCLASVSYQHFQTSSPQKPIDRFKPNIIWSLHELGNESLSTGSRLHCQDGRHAI